MSDTRRKVTSVGNSWIICQSKSHPGSTYYFNTGTGVAVWDIDDAQIEKAKRATKQLQNLQGGEPIKCPEPNDKPPGTLKKSAEPSVSSEQFVMNKFSEQQSSLVTYTNVGNSNDTFHTPFNQISGLMQGANDSFLNTTATIYNPKVWNLPHVQQVLIAGAIAPVANQNLLPLNVGLSQNVSQPATALVFNNLGNASQSITSDQTYYPREFSHDQGVKWTMDKTKELRKKNDLRQKLLFLNRREKKIAFFNKKSTNPGVSGLLIANNNTRQPDTAAHFVNQVEGNHSKNLGSGMENRCKEKPLHTTPSKIDLEPLKCLAAPDSNSNAWFIVVDLEVLLHEFKFLTTLTDSDEKCYLMVPKRVMEKLQTYVNDTENIQAKRILRFLSQQIEIGYAYLAKEPSKVEGDGMADVILATCKELLDNKNHLILLSNDSHILNIDSSYIHIFSINDVKTFLMGNSNKTTSVSQSTGPKTPFMTNELCNKIQIIVPNNVLRNIDTSPVSATQSSNHIVNISPKQNNTPDKPDELIVLKHTADVSIQTDMEEINANTVNVVKQQSPNAVSTVQSQPIAKRSVSLLSNTLAKKREILLKRATSHQPITHSVETEKKQFKWRRRRNTSQANEQILSNNQINTNNVESQSNVLNNEISYTLPDKENNSALCIESKISDESFEFMDSSINAEPNATSKENVTIEQTSTCGIISNIESNVYDDGTYSNLTYSIIQQRVDNKVMYEVESIAMEQYLRTKCDEWISRLIQIMEEVLSEVLQQDPKFTHKSMPPPWTLYEAVQCIVIKFHGNKGIAAAANELSDILFKVSDESGKIIDVTPVYYMQMYSYSVHLLDEITEVAGCEEIQIAVESLKKLLFDIRNPIMESNNSFSENRQDDLSHHDTFSDIDDDEIISPEEETLPESSSTKEESIDNPKENTTFEKELQKPIKFIRRIDVSFPLSKGLRNTTINKFMSPVKDNETQRSTVSQQEGNNLQNAIMTSEKGTDSDVPTNQIKIIRTFTKFPMFERIIIKNNKKLRLDANGQEKQTDKQTNKVANTTTPNEPESQSDAVLIDDNNKKFKYMIYTFLREIKEALSQVQVLCYQLYQEFLEPGRSTAQKYELLKRAEKAHLLILRLSRSLESMLDHEAKNPSRSMSALLEQADIDIQRLDADLLVAYRISIEKCKAYTDEFLSSIANIISEVTRTLGCEAVGHASALNSEKT